MDTEIKRMRDLEKGDIIRFTPMGPLFRVERKDSFLYFKQVEESARGYRLCGGYAVRGYTSVIGTKSMQFVHVLKK